MNRNVILLASIISLPASLGAQSPTQSDLGLQRKVDSIATQVLRATGVPSATVAVVRHGQLAYTNAYGCARLNPCVSATPEMR